MVDRVTDIAHLDTISYAGSAIHHAAYHVVKASRDIRYAAYAVSRAADVAGRAADVAYDAANNNERRLQVEWFIKEFEKEAV